MLESSQTARKLKRTLDGKSRARCLCLGSNFTRHAAEKVGQRFMLLVESVLCRTECSSTDETNGSCINQLWRVGRRVVSTEASYPLLSKFVQRLSEVLFRQFSITATPTLRYLYTLKDSWCDYEMVTSSRYSRLDWATTGLLSTGRARCNEG